MGTAHSLYNRATFERSCHAKLTEDCFSRRKLRARIPSGGPISDWPEMGERATRGLRPASLPGSLCIASTFVLAASIMTHCRKRQCSCIPALVLSLQSRGLCREPIEAESYARSPVVPFPTRPADAGFSPGGFRVGQGREGCISHRTKAQRSGFCSERTCRGIYKHSPCGRMCRYDAA